mgnify:CR=1 FL=1
MFADVITILRSGWKNWYLEEVLIDLLHYDHVGVAGASDCAGIFVKIDSEALLAHLRD